MDEKNNSSDAGASPLVAGHTPGPWVIGGSEGGIIKTAPAEDDSWRFIAEVIVNAALITDEERANARLIAAAPDLLAALKVAQKLAAGGLSPAPASDPRWVLIADAIEKAEGVASVSASAEGGSHSPNSPKGA